MSAGDGVDELVERTAGVSWSELADETRDSARALVLDALGLAAGAVAAPSLPASAAALARWSSPVTPGSGIHVPFWSSFGSVTDAAFAFSLAVHAWDFDDTHDEAVVHTSCVALPAGLAVGQECGASGETVLAGMVAGIELLSRLSLVVGPQSGVIRTAGLGSLGAAAAAARVLQLGSVRTRNALALALPAALAPTTRQVVIDSAVNKRHQPGFAVRAGVSAAYLAAEGVEGPAGWFAGEHGLAQGRDAVEDGEALLARPGWEVDRVSLKPYPACRYAHAAVAGVLELTGGVPTSATALVHLPTGSGHVMVARPFERRGTAIVDAQFSVPWLVAAALVRGRVGLSEMTEEVLLDREVEHVARTRVRVVQDQDTSARVMTPVVVELIDDSGSHSTVVEALPGSPARRLGRGEQLTKVKGCLVAARRDPAAATAVAAFVDDLEHLARTDLSNELIRATPAEGAALPQTKERVL